MRLEKHFIKSQVIIWNYFN